MAYSEIFLVCAVFFGFLMAFGIGANDVANAMGTSVGSKAISLKQAIIISAVFESAGALLAGGEVTATIRGNILNVGALSVNPDFMIYGMLASLLAAGLWLIIASSRGWPVSTTHSIVGAIVGFAAIGIGPSYVNWYKIIDIVLSWIVTPLIAAVIAFAMYKCIQKALFNTEQKSQRSILFILLIFLGLSVFIIALVTVTKGMKHLNLDLSIPMSFVVAFFIAILASILGYWVLAKRINQQVDNHLFIEKCFGILMIFTACAMMFAHGSNDVANAVGPLAAIFDIINTNGHMTVHSPLPKFVLLIGALGMVAGLALYGYRVLETIGTGITKLTPSLGFSAELATAITVIMASGLGLPVSTTQTLVGAVIGVGLANGLNSLKLGTIKKIVMSWVITLPVGAVLSALFFFALKAIF